MTQGESLRHWQEIGILERELALFRRLVQRGKRIALFTYGGVDDAEVLPASSGVEVFSGGMRLPRSAFGPMMAWRHAGVLRAARVIRSNQFGGAFAAAICASAHRRPFICRGGHLPSLDLAVRSGARSPAVMRARLTERASVQRADRVVVTTRRMADAIVRICPACDEKTRVIPNYVETERFVPATADARWDVAYVGRFAPQKNLGSLVEATEGLGLRLLLVGQGPLRDALLERARAARTAIDVVGPVDNAALPALLVQSRVFAMVSHYEGHPKALMEAMACGLPVLGSRVPGIEEVIEHTVTGWLCAESASSIAAGLRELLSDEARLARLGRAAREWAVRNCSLESVVELELQVQDEAVEAWQRKRGRAHARA